MAPRCQPSCPVLSWIRPQPHRLQYRHWNTFQQFVPSLNSIKKCSLCKLPLSFVSNFNKQYLYIWWPIISRESKTVFQGYFALKHNILSLDCPSNFSANSCTMRFSCQAIFRILNNFYVFHVNKNHLSISCAMPSLPIWKAGAQL